MPWPIVRRVAAAAAVSATSLAVLVVGVPAVSTGRPWLTALDRCALAALLVGAVLQWAVPRPDLVWLISGTAIAIACFATAGRPGRLEAVSAIAVALATPLLLVLVVQVPTSSGRGPGLIAATVAIAALGLIRALVYEPFDDIDCTGLCRHNPVLVSADLPLAHNLGIVAAAATIVVAGLVVRQAIRSRRSPRPTGHLADAAHTCVAAAATVLGLDAGIRLTSNTVAAPSNATVAAITAPLVASVLVSGALVLTALDPLRARRDVSRVARILARTQGPSDVQEIFRTAFGDPALEVGYWADGIGYLDKNGEPLAIPSARSRIELVSRGGPIAVIVHGRDALSSELLTQQLGPHALLAIHNESLTLELNRSIREVERSRRRIVEVSDHERRRLERDLHDGAQQRLLALSFELRRGERAAIAAHDACASEGFGRAGDLAQIALDQLRELAHGIHPSILNGAGLHDALSEFGAAHGCKISIAVDDADQLSASVQSTIYDVATAVIAGTAAVPSISVRCHGDSVRLSFDHVADLPQHAIDRAEAVGGKCAKTEQGVEVAFPCVS